MPAPTVLSPRGTTIRHLKFGLSTDPGAVQVLGQWFVPQPRNGVNGERGWVVGEYETRLGEEGSFTLRFPNAAGEDGMLHRDRFEVVTKGRREWSVGQTISTVGGGTYRPGDEWIEIYETAGSDAFGDLLFVGTPTRFRISLSAVEISGYDAYWLLKKQRDTAAGAWCEAPRQVMAHYSRAWVYTNADVFGADGAAETRFTHSIFLQTAGSWKYARCQNGSTSGNQWKSTVRLDGQTVGDGGKAVLASNNTLKIGYGMDCFWRAEATVFAPSLSTVVDSFIRMAIIAPSYPAGQNPIIEIRVGRKTPDPGFGTAPPNLTVYWAASMGTGAAGAVREVATNLPQEPGPFELAVEARGRWVWLYVNGEVVGNFQSEVGATTDVYPQVEYWGPAATAQSAYVDTFKIKTTRPFLQTPDPFGSDAWGDTFIPGLPPAGGLQGEYYSMIELLSSQETAETRRKQAMAPIREPYARRLDGRVSLDGDAVVGSSTSVPSGAPIEPVGGIARYFAVRWTGSVYMDLATADVILRINATPAFADQLQWWVGDTMRLSPLGAATNYSMRAFTSWDGTSNEKAGWYPIVIEFFVDQVYPWFIQMLKNGSLCPASDLSPIGVFKQHNRFESHYDGFAEVARDFGHQFTLEPKQLESGQFPGLLVPWVRVGRDTDKVIDNVEVTGMQVEGSAEDVADVLIADAQGLASPTGGGQITAEAVDFSEVKGSVVDVPVAGSHLVATTEYDTMGEIATSDQLRIRLDSLLALRGSVYEQVSATPAGQSELTDTFPLTGSVARFAWRPGDGVRLRFPEVKVEDASPRQIMGIRWSVLPDGVSRPSVSFRQRTRNLADALRRLRRESLNQYRNYQTQFAVVSGSAGSNAASGGVPSGAADGYSRVLLPENLGNILSATLVVHYKSDITQWQIQVNDQTRLYVNYPGRYDVGAWAYRVNNEPKMYAKMIPSGGSTGSASYTLELVVKI